MGSDAEFLCIPAWLPDISREPMTRTRLALQATTIPKPENDTEREEIYCAWDAEAQSLLIDPTAQTPEEKEVCERLDRWDSIFGVAPWLLMMAYVVTGIIALLRFSHMKARDDGDREEVEGSARTVFIIFVGLIFFLYIGLSVFDSFDETPQLASYFLQFVIAVVCIMIGWAWHEFLQFSNLGGAASSLMVDAVSFLPQIFANEWAQAVLALIVVFPMIAIVIMASVWELVRRRDPRDSTWWEKLFSLISGWHTVSILDKWFLIGCAYLGLAVIAGEFTKIALAWLDIHLATMGMVPVTILFSLFGAFMFLNPAAPGLPVYVASGLVICPKAQAIGWSRGGSWIYGMAVALAIKLIASGLQMMIGRGLGAWKSIRYTVGMHTPIMRSIEIILREEKFTFMKFSIINGGPDWPTSVFCGMVGMPIIPVLFWTIPTLLVIAPTVVAGSTFLSIEGTWQSVSQLLTVAAASIQSSLTLSAMRSVGIVSAKHAEELAIPRPADQELIDLDEDAVKSKVGVNMISEWKNISHMARFLLVTSAVLTIVPSIVITANKASYVRNFSMGTDFRGPPLYGDIRRIFTDAGSRVLACFPIAAVCNAVFWVLVAKTAPDPDYEAHRADIELSGTFAGTSFGSNSGTIRLTVQGENEKMVDKDTGKEDHQPEMTAKAVDKPDGIDWMIPLVSQDKRGSRRASRQERKSSTQQPTSSRISPTSSGITLGAPLERPASQS